MLPLHVRWKAFQRALRNKLTFGSIDPKPHGGTNLLNELDSPLNCVYLCINNNNYYYSMPAWYIDDGVIAGSKQAVVQALSIIQDLGPPLGLVINSSKCELYGDCDLQPFPSEMKKCNAFNFEILGAPIGNTIFCAKFIAEKRAGASKFLALLKEVGSLDSQVALVLLRQCGGFCRFVHIARCTPPSLASEGLHFFDIDVHQCFSDCLSIDLPNTAWQQAQLCLSRGGSIQQQRM